jgi:hypothetical protein
VLDGPCQQVHQYAGSGRRRGQIVEARHPLLHHQRAGGVGFSLEFARRCAADSGRPVLLVPCACGSSGFVVHRGRTWNRHDRSGAVNLFAFADQQIAGALMARPDNVLAVILWHQGETDARFTSGEDYARMLDDTFTELRRGFGADVPIVMGGMVPEQIRDGTPGFPVIDAVHRATPRRLPQVAFVAGPAGAHNAAGSLHYNAAGQRELGARMFAAYRELRERQPS